MAANLDRAETSLTAVSDIAYIRGIDSSGNSVRISKADLASVLGVRSYRKGNAITSISDFNDFINESTDYYNDFIVSWGQDAQHAPFRSCDLAHLHVYNRSVYHGIQLVASPFNNSIYFRLKQSQTWYSWQRVSMDIPEFYKSYSTLAELKAALANA